MFESCTRTVGGTRFGVAHGDYLVDVASCRRCLCDDGSLTECEPAQTCQSIQLNPTSCQYDGNTISHGERFDVSNTKSSSFTPLLLLRRLAAMNVVATMVTSGAPDEAVIEPLFEISALPAILTLPLKCVASME